MSAPETQARQALIGMLAAEFVEEAFPIKDDKLHGSVGRDGTVLAVYPERTVSSVRDRYVSEMNMVVQFYGKFDAMVDPNQTVSPAIIEGYADRFRNALRTSNPDPNTGAVWYFTLLAVNYTPDPTGNISRFEAHLLARGNNGALISETGA